MRKPSPSSRSLYSHCSRILGNSVNSADSLPFLNPLFGAPPKRAFFLAVVAVVALVSADKGFAQAELSGSQEELREILFPRPNQVTIEGSSEIQAFMDRATVELLVTNEKRLLEVAMSSNQQLRAELSDAFITAGIDPQAINNDNFSSSPQRGLFSRQTNGYEVSARLRVKVSSEAQLQLLAAAADRHEEVELGEMTFEHSARRAFELQAREFALRDALAQASTYGETLGLTLSPVNFYTQSTARLPRYEARLLSRASAMMDEIATPAAQNFDEVMYSTTVTVTFEISGD